MTTIIFIAQIIYIIAGLAALTFCAIVVADIRFSVTNGKLSISRDRTEHAVNKTIDEIDRKCRQGHGKDADLHF